MCNVWCNDFGQKAKRYVSTECSALEVGSRNVNGSLRELLAGYVKEYVGVDLFEGCGVDRVMNVLDLSTTYGKGSFDLVLSTEMLEHCFEWEDALYQMMYVLKKGGILVITTRSPGFELHDYPADHWRFSRDDFEQIFSPVSEILELESDMTLGWPCGIGIILRKICNDYELKEWREQLEKISVYSMQTEMKSISVPDQTGNGGRIIFDQYSRYKACADLLKQTGFSSGNTILDVGSGPECLFGQFLPNASMTYVDPLIQGGAQRDRITGNVFASELDGQTFNCVTALDVFEHVPPQYREVFLDRLSSLTKNILILGFPTSDTSDALDVDKSINDQYRTVFGRHYSWLEEHQRFGLPSLAETVDHLARLGWHYQTMGHGHAPWLQELLGFVVCAWEIPALKNIVLEASETFNQDIYPLDFRAPHYRQFVIASRAPLPSITPPVMNNESESESAFRKLMDETSRQYFIVSMRQLMERDCALAEGDRAVAERDRAVAERDRAVAERDRAVAEREEAARRRDSAEALASLLKQSTSWRLTRPLRFLARLIRHGLTNDDRRRLTQVLRSRYHRLPLPTPTKRWVSFIYHHVIHKAIRSIRRGTLRVTQFTPPAVKPASQQNEKPDYIIWGVIDWHFRHQRPQQLSLALTATNRRVFYISPALVDDERAGFEAEALCPSGQIFQITLFANGTPSIYSNVRSLETIAQLRQGIGEVLAWADCKQIVSLVDHPFWYGIANVLPNSRLVYDCMDHHKGFGNNSESVLQLEKQLLSEAELTIATSTWLANAIAPHARKSELIRNAGDYVHFSKVPASIYRDHEERRIIGYFGAIAEWFDLDLVEAVAMQYPDCCVLLIGADTINAKSKLSKLHNIIFTGEMPYSQLPHYLYSFDVCLLPFRVIPLTWATNPVKVYEYLSAGKPVVSVDLPEIAQFEGLVYAATGKEAFLASVDAVLSQPESDTLVQKRKAFAQNQTWQHRAETLIQHAESRASDPKVSVVVVTYNNLELTRACLSSLDEYCENTQLEIIAVDNASSDGSRTFLSEWVSGKSNRKLILNDENRGFAAANNQGLEVAIGDYLVLLNNDTYVTPGWICTLVRHLERDKTIGLIGPVTNNIGNEAKIDIAYEDTAGMLLKSAAYTRKHVGQTYPLRTAAFFCVMMPRSTYEHIGKLDETFGQGFFEDDDYCRRIEQLGLRIVCAEDVFIHHHLSASFNKLKQQDRQRLFDQNKATYEAKWGKWLPHSYRSSLSFSQPKPEDPPDTFSEDKYIAGQCVICGRSGRFYYNNIALWRESLNCQHCRSTSRYRSIARGLLRAISDLTGVIAPSLANLPTLNQRRLSVYDTQPPYYYGSSAYPIPDFLKKTHWIKVTCSQYKPKREMGETIAEGITNQNLECLTYADESLDIVITSDVMEHVRLDGRAHREIYRVLKPGGIYLFTVPHDRSWEKTLTRVQINDPDDPAKDIHLLEPEYHGDTNSEGKGGVLAYRTYGKDLEAFLAAVGFVVEYEHEDYEDIAIMNTELFYCRKSYVLGLQAPENVHKP